MKREDLVRVIQALRTHCRLNTAPVLFGDKGSICYDGIYIDSRILATLILAPQDEAAEDRKDRCHRKLVDAGRRLSAFQHTEFGDALDESEAALADELDGAVEKANYETALKFIEEHNEVLASSQERLDAAKAVVIEYENRKDSAR